jgi:hypothetical protein
MERDFKGVWISKEVWLDNRLTAVEKVILMEIDSLDCGENGCFASNQYLAEFCQCSETKVSTAISKLIKLGYLTVKSFDGRKRELKSRLSKIERQGVKKEKAETQKVKDNNITNKTLTTKSKKERNSYNTIINEYTDDEETVKAIGEFIVFFQAKQGRYILNKELRAFLDNLSAMCLLNAWQIKACIANNDLQLAFIENYYDLQGEEK